LFFIIIFLFIWFIFNSGFLRFNPIYEADCWSSNRPSSAGVAR